MSNIDQGFNVDVLSLSDNTLISSGTFDPRVTGFEAPAGSMFLYKNGNQGVILVKDGPLNTDWASLSAGVGLPMGGATNDILYKTSNNNYDVAFGPITADMAPNAKTLVNVAKNDTGTTIPKGTPVYQTGIAGAGFTLLVRPADAADPTKMPAVGVLGEDLAPAQEGQLLILGDIQGVNTSAFTEGDLVYVAPGGGYTNVKPTASNHAIQFLGIVTKVHATNGGGVITGTGTLDIFKDGANEYYGWSGTTWERLAVDAEVVHKAGDSMTGSLSLPKTKGEAILIDNGYSWMDIIGDVSPKALGTSAAVLRPFQGSVTGWTHDAGSYGELTYHMPHTYAHGTDLNIHVHWGHNGTNISGSFIVKFYASYAKRTYPATPFSAPVELTLSVTGLNLTNSPQFCHRVDEILLSTPGGSTNLLDTDLIETDGLVMLHYVIDTIPSIGGSTVSNLPYIQTIDLHVQSTNIGTKNKDPDFWS